MLSNVAFKCNLRHYTEYAALNSSAAAPWTVSVSIKDDDFAARPGPRPLNTFLF